MKPDLYTNALSRLADIMICDECGMDEAKLAFMGAPTSLYQWAALQPEKPKGDFKAMTGEEAWNIIQKEHAGEMFRLYKRFLNCEEPEEIRFLAFEKCPGLEQIWTEPYQMKYRCRDGSLIIQFKTTADGWEMVADLVDGK